MVLPYSRREGGGERMIETAKILIALVLPLCLALFLARGEARRRFCCGGEKWGRNRDKSRMKPLYIGTGTIFAPAFLYNRNDISYYIKKGCAEGSSPRRPQEGAQTAWQSPKGT